RSGRRREEVGLGRAGLEVEQELLAFETARIPRERAVGADHAVARDDDRDRVRTVREPDRSRPTRWHPESAGDLAVRRGLAIRDLLELSPDPALEVGAPR